MRRIVNIIETVADVVGYLAVSLILLTISIALLMLTTYGLYQLMMVVS